MLQHGSCPPGHPVQDRLATVALTRRPSLHPSPRHHQANAGRFIVRPGGFVLGNVRRTAAVQTHRAGPFCDDSKHIPSQLPKETAGTARYEENGPGPADRGHRI